MSKMNKQKGISFDGSHNFEIITADGFWGIVQLKSGSTGVTFPDYFTLVEMDEMLKHVKWIRGPFQVSANFPGAMPGKISIVSIATKATITRDFPDEIQGYTSGPFCAGPFCADCGATTTNTYRWQEGYRCGSCHRAANDRLMKKNKSVRTPLSPYEKKSVSAKPKSPLDHMTYDDFYWNYVHWEELGRWASGLTEENPPPSFWLEKMLDKVTLNMQPQPNFSTWVSCPDPFVVAHQIAEKVLKKEESLMRKAWKSPTFYGFRIGVAVFMLLSLIHYIFMVFI